MSGSSTCAAGDNTCNQGSAPAGGELRCALDLGSGATKMTTARLVNGSISELVLSQVDEILVRENVARRGNNTIGDDVLLDVSNAVTKMVANARRAGATKFAAVATAVYRTSDNGEAFIRKLSQDLGINIQLVNQSIEGALGYYTAAAIVPGQSSGDPLLAWDSGGGSFQLTTRKEGAGNQADTGDDGATVTGREAGVAGEFEVYEGPCGASTVFAWLLKIQGRQLDLHHSANPASYRCLRPRSSL
jgi:exopolyphosphatase/guanosine-5'-triphosphate,3'-diphosphate pyrophosphatase